jgi:trk system potassium uptake protein TrkH
VPNAPPKVHGGGHYARRFVATLAALILSGTALLMLPWATESGEATPPVDAFFTAVSAVCVTGLVTLDTGSHWSFAGEAIILLLFQIGGLGFMVGASLVLLVLRREVGLRESLLMQAGGPTLSLREAIDLSGRIVRFTFVLEGIGAVLLTARFLMDMPLGPALWKGIFYSVSSFCNAGFDLEGGFVSLTPYRTSLLVNAVVMVLIQAGALSYIVFSDVATKRNWRQLSLDTKLVLVVNGVLLLTGAFVVLGVEWDSALAETPLWARPIVALFQSTARTAGFSTVDFGLFHMGTLFVWLVLMGIGGASGSVAGGVKMTTVGVLGAAVGSTLRGQIEPQIFGRRLPVSLVFRAMAVIILFVVLHFVATLVLVLVQTLAHEGSESFIALMFEAMSALATVGLSTGVTPDLSEAGKLVLCATMFIGRLGPLTATYALQRRQHQPRYRFPETAVRIG